MKVTNFSSAVLVILGCAMLLVSCGPSSEERASRAAAAEAKRAELAQRQAPLRARAEQRIANGDSGPERVEDPGYQVGRCVRPKPPENVAWLASGVMMFNAVCENTAAGRKVIAWRDWYCEGDYTCVLSNWRDGEPLFTGRLSQVLRVTFSPTDVMVVEPPKWPGN